jgi:hypothetical protein
MEFENKININELKESIREIEIINKNLIVLFISTKHEGNYIVLKHAETFRREYREKFSLIVPTFTKESWNDFLNYLHERAIKGSITGDSYTQELVCRILQKDSSLCLEQTTEDHIQSVLDSKDIIVPAVIFKTIFAEWGYPVLRKIKRADKMFPYSVTLNDIFNELRNGVLYR